MSWAFGHSGFVRGCVAVWLGGAGARARCPPAGRALRVHGAVVRQWCAGGAPHGCVGARPGAPPAMHRWAPTSGQALSLDRPGFLNPWIPTPGFLGRVTSANVPKPPTHVYEHADTRVRTRGHAGKG